MAPQTNRQCALFLLGTKLPPELVAIIAEYCRLPTNLSDFFKSRAAAIKELHIVSPNSPMFPLSFKNGIFMLIIPPGRNDRLGMHWSDIPCLYVFNLTARQLGVGNWFSRGNWSLLRDNDES